MFLGDRPHLAVSVTRVRISSGREAVRVEGGSGTKDPLDGVKLVTIERVPAMASKGGLVRASTEHGHCTAGV